ncbi:hypothetical protein M5D96_003523, partial [Drosophila gunungcola]
MTAICAGRRVIGEPLQRTWMLGRSHLQNGIKMLHGNKKDSANQPAKQAMTVINSQVKLSRGTSEQWRQQETIFALVVCFFRRTQNFQFIQSYRTRCPGSQDIFSMATNVPSVPL